MKVKDFMTQKVLTITTDESVEKVFFIFNTNSLRHLPVMEDGKLAGIISERDLKKTLPLKAKKIMRSDGTSYSRVEDSLPHNAILLVRMERGGYKIGPLQVKHIMQTKVKTISPEEEMSKAASIMAESKIGSLLVLEDKKIVGIITTTNVLHAFVQMTQAKGNSK